MSRHSAPESVESRRHQPDVASNDALQPYRLDGGVTRLSTGFNLPRDGKIEIPSLWQPNNTDFKPGNESPRLSPDVKPASSEHTVKPKDSLWKIAKDALSDAGDGAASAPQIAQKVQAIIQANKGEYPSLARFPNEIKPGMKLQIPGQEAPGEERSQRVRPEKVEPEKTAGERRRDGRDSREGRNGRDERAADGDLSTKRGKTRDVKPAQDGDDKTAQEGDGGRLAKALKKFGQDIADTAIEVARSLGTKGNCAKGPRLTFGEYGFKLPPAIATRQGRMIEQSGLFEEVSREDARPGDYGVRDWNSRVARRHGVNKGDSFIVTNVSANGSLRGANDHTFNVPEDGGRYRNLKFYRPTVEFFKKYGPGSF